MIISLNNAAFCQKESLHESLSWITDNGGKVVTVQSVFRPRLECNGPFAYGEHAVYYDLASRCDAVAVQTKHSRYALMEVPDSVLLEPRPGIVVLRPSIDDSFGFWQSMKLLANHIGAPVIVKSVSVKEFEVARSFFGCRTYQVGEGWSTLAQFDDQTYSEVVLKLDEAIPKYDLPRVPVNFYQTNAAHLEEVSTLLTRNWKEWFVSRYPAWKAEDLDLYYSLAFSKRILEGVDWIFVCETTERIVAVCVASRIAKDQVDLWVCMSDGQPARVSRAFYAWLTKIFKEWGFQYMGLGGSEQPGLHWFKSSLGPHLLFDRYHVVVEN